MNKNSNYRALIDNGKFSGKPPHVYYVYDVNKELSENSKNLIQDGYCYIIDLTEEEYNYIINRYDIEIGYFKDGKTIQSKFYY